MAEQLLHTVDEVAELTQLSRAYIYDQVAAGALKACRFGRVIRIRDEDLRAYIDEHLEAGAEADPGMVRLLREAAEA